MKRKIHNFNKMFEFEIIKYEHLENKFSLEFLFSWLLINETRNKFKTNKNFLQDETKYPFLVSFLQNCKKKKIWRTRVKLFFYKNQFFTSFFHSIILLTFKFKFRNLCKKRKEINFTQQKIKITLVCQIFFSKHSDYILINWIFLVFVFNS